MDWTDSDRRRDLALVFGGALGLRLLFSLGLVDAMPLMADAVSYDAMAKELLTAFPGNEAFYWPPGLPSLLAGWYAVFGAGVEAARGFASVVGATNAALVYILAGQMWNDTRLARGAGGLMALYPPSVMMTCQVVSQPVEMTALLGATVLLLVGWQQARWTAFAGAGLAIGLGGLVRPSLLSVVVAGLVLAVGVAYCTDDRRRSASRRAMVVGTGVGLVLLAGVLAPVVSHNQAHGGGWTLSTNNAHNLFLGNNPHTPLYKTNHLASRSPEQLPDTVGDYLRSMRQQENARQALLRETATYVVHNPGTTLLRTLNRMREFWGFDYVTSRRIQIAYGLGWPSLVALLALEAGVYVAVMLLVLAGVVEPWGRLGGPAGLVGTLLVGYQLPYWVAFSAGTYHYTAVGLLMPFAARGGTVVWEWLQGRRALRSPFFLGLAAAAFCLLQLEYAYFTYVYMPATLGG